MKRKKERKSWKQIKSAKKKKADEYTCLLAYMRRMSEGHLIQFTIEDSYGNSIPVTFDNGRVEIAGQEKEEEDALVYVARWPEDFERLFFSAAKGKINEKALVRGFQIAKLADMSGTKGHPAVVPVTAKDGIRMLQITRDKDRPSFSLDGTAINSCEAEKFIDREYVNFLAGYKTAVRSLRRGEYGTPENKKKTAAWNTMLQQKGRPIVDIDGYLGAEINTKGTSAQMPKTLLGQEFLTGKARGHVGITGKDGGHAGK